MIPYDNRLLEDELRVAPAATAIVRSCPGKSQVEGCPAFPGRDPRAGFVPLLPAGPRAPTDRPQAPAALDLAQKVERLKDPRTYPQPPERIEAIQTHMSWVFLTETLAYKLKKPVHYEFLDFSTLAAREWNCREELRLNQTLAPAVYLAVVPLSVDAAGAVRLEGEGATIDWLVKMRRLPADRMLDRLIRAKQLDLRDLERLADVLVRFYRSATPVGLAASTYRRRFEQAIALNRAVLASPKYALPANRVAATHDALSLALRTDPAVFDRRVHERRILEAHGDLRPEHVCMEERPVVFDRLEFKRDFRLLDPVDELCYLAMECERLGRPDIGPMLLDAYRAATGDVVPERLQRFYGAHRACTRARLSALHADELPAPAARRWLDAACAYLQLAHAYITAL